MGVTCLQGQIYQHLRSGDCCPPPPGSRKLLCPHLDLRCHLRGSRCLCVCCPMCVFCFYRHRKLPGEGISGQVWRVSMAFSRDRSHGAGVPQGGSSSWLWWLQVICTVSVAGKVKESICFHRGSSWGDCPVVKVSMSWKLVICQGEPATHLLGTKGQPS